MMAMVFCRGCGKEIHETAVACPYCGCQQVAAAVGNIKSQNVATVLAAFLGGLGIHRFYLNRPVSGIIYLLLCWTGIPSLIASVETIIYAFTSQQNWARKYNNGLISAPAHILAKLLALVFPIVFVIGILAAIAIPAYQHYKARAAYVSVQAESMHVAAYRDLPELGSYHWKTGA
jgi:TM2 domain-containing membrane protein YozV